MHSTGSHCAVPVLASTLLWQCRSVFEHVLLLTWNAGWAHIHTIADAARVALAASSQRHQAIQLSESCGTERARSPSSYSRTARNAQSSQERLLDAGASSRFANEFIVTFSSPKRGCKGQMDLIYWSAGLTRTRRAPQAQRTVIGMQGQGGTGQETVCGIAFSNSKITHTSQQQHHIRPPSVPVAMAQAITAKDTATCAKLPGVLGHHCSTAGTATGWHAQRRRPSPAARSRHTPASRSLNTTNQLPTILRKPNPTTHQCPP